MKESDVQKDYFSAYIFIPTQNEGRLLLNLLSKVYNLLFFFSFSQIDCILFKPLIAFQLFG